MYDDKTHKLIATISPDTYCQEVKEKNGEVIKVREEVKKLAKEKGYTSALEKVELINVNEHPLYNYDDAKADALNLWGLKSPVEKHVLIYDSPAEGLEPVYFWLLDFLTPLYKNIYKISDNFTSSPGSGHFSEMQSRATQMQQEVSRSMGNVNTVIKSVLNLVYDLKEFKLRLKPYQLYKDEKTSNEDKYKQLLSLKQIWLDNVDIRKGRGSVNALSSGELDFVTLRDAFMSIKNIDNVKEIDLNERVKRMLQQRAQEFFEWIEESYISLNQRYEIERNYLKSQVNMLKLYTRWVKPYLRAAQKLEQNYASKDPALVSVFNTMVLELKLLATSKYDINDDVAAGLVPDLFSKIKTREYSKVLVVELDFRSIPQKVSQRGDWAFGGRAEVRFTSYALNDQEIETLKTALDEDDLKTALGLIEGATEGSLEQIRKDLEDLIDDKKEKKDKEEPKKQGSSNDDFGFKALFSAFKLKKKEDKPWKIGEIISPDNEYEKVIRSQAAISARESCFTIFDTYKKSRGMPSHSDPTLPL